jgi:hypothetical protein
MRTMCRQVPHWKQLLKLYHMLTRDIYQPSQRHCCSAKCGSQSRSVRSRFLDAWISHVLGQHSAEKPSEWGRLPLKGSGALLGFGSTSSLVVWRAGFESNEALGNLGTRIPTCPPVYGPLTCTWLHDSGEPGLPAFRLHVSGETP